MKILVTGGAGFIGSSLSDELIKRRHQVVIVDNLSTGFKKNINPEAKFFQANLANFKKIDNILKKEKPQAVFHLAAQIDVRKSVANPLADARINILAGINLIKLAREYGVKKFIFSSTGGTIYGDTQKRPTKESHPEWPLSPYGIAKLTIDKYLNYFNQVCGLKYTSLRYGNVYGPRQNPLGEAGVVAIFLNKMLRGEQPVINGDGRQTRDYVFVDDVVKANISALQNINKIGVFNIGTGKEASVNEIFRLIRNCAGNKKIKEEHGPAKPGEQLTSCLNASRARQELNWQPKINLDEGIKRTFEWFRKNSQKK